LASFLLALRLASNDGGERGLPTVDGVTAPWSLEHIVEKAIEVGTNPVVGLLVDVVENAGYAKGAGHLLTGVSIFGDSYHYFGTRDINRGQYIYRLSGTTLVAGLTFLGSPIPIAGPALSFYEKAYFQIKEKYMELYNRVNDVNWWMQHGYQ